MKKLMFLALMLMGGMAAQAQDVLVGVYDLDKESVEDNAIKGKQTVETKTTMIMPLVTTAELTDDDVMIVTADSAMTKVEVVDADTKEVIRVIDLALTKKAEVDLKPYAARKVKVIFYAENGQTSEYDWN